MGGILSRTTGDNQVVEITTNNAYRYPPKTGSYFSNYFIMGGERFDMPQPESYLFGDNDDLNFIGNRPTPFPYPNNQGNEPTKMLKSLVNIRKSSLRFIKTAEPSAKSEPDSETNPDKIDDNVTRYNIEFTFDADVKCAITIYYFATEEIVNSRIYYHPRDPSMNSETYNYKQGANQTFSQSSHILDPSKFNNEDWQYDSESSVIPMVVHCLVEDEEHAGHSHVTFATIDLNTELGYVLKPLKQKQFIDGLTYLLQEIYGIENKNLEKSKDPDDEIDDTGAECIICMSDMRDTLILPCRHLCLCSKCAESLRYQSSNCPICRSNFRALLQLRAMRKKQHQAMLPQRDGEREENAVSQEGVPAGFEAVSLFEALNGPMTTRSPSNDGTQTRTTGRGDGKADKKKSVKSRHHEGRVHERVNIVSETGGTDPRINDALYNVKHGYTPYCMYHYSRHHEGRVHERVNIVSETGGTDPRINDEDTPPVAVRSPTHSSKKNHPSHNRHTNKTGEKRTKTLASDKTDVTEKQGEGTADPYSVYQIDESDPAADDADDEQSSDEDLNKGETTKVKAMIATGDRDALADDHTSDTDSQVCDHIEMSTMSVDCKPLVTPPDSLVTPPDSLASPLDSPITSQESHASTNENSATTTNADDKPSDKDSTGNSTGNKPKDNVTDLSSFSSTESAQDLLPVV